MFRVVILVVLLFATFNGQMRIVLSVTTLRDGLVPDGVVKPSGRGTGLSGTVTEFFTHAPIPNVTISIEVRNAYGGTVRLSRTSTDNNGCFLVPWGLPPGYTVRVTASKPGFKDATILLET